MSGLKCGVAGEVKLGRARPGQVKWVVGWASENRRSCYGNKKEVG